MENPNSHITTFLEKCDTIHINSVSNDNTCFWLFPVLVKGQAKSLLLNWNANSFTTSDGLSNAFLCKYFPPRKTANLYDDIISFFEMNDESLYMA